MSLVRVPAAGSIGLNQDLSKHDLPLGAWTDCLNIRFLDGYAWQTFGHGEVYNSPAFAPQHVLPCNISGSRYWIYTTAAKTYAVTISGGVAVHTDITHATPRTGVVNKWTSTLIGGIPVLNTGDTTSVPMSWDLNLGNKFVNLTAWPANTYAKSIRTFRNYLIALNITKAGVSYPFMFKSSHAADPGFLPSSWDETDPTKDCVQFDLAEGYDVVVDGMQLRDSFIVYKEASVWRVDFTGGTFVLNRQKVLGTSGALNVNCIVEVDGFHFVVTNNDIVTHDGQQAISILDQKTRRWFFQNIDVNAVDKVFVFKNPFFNEVYVCFPAIGSSVCNRAIVWNYHGNTVSVREMPNVNHANFGPVDNGLTGNWAQDSAPWDSDLTAWNGPDFVPSTARVLMGCDNSKIYMLDSSSSFDGVMPTAYMERRGLSLGEPETMKLVRGVRPRITGNVGQTVTIKVGSQADPYADPDYQAVGTFTIGQTPPAFDCMVTGRYFALRIESGGAFQWRMDSYDLDVVPAGSF